LPRPISIRAKEVGAAPDTIDAGDEAGGGIPDSTQHQ
jgi:hypothetical protein